MHCNNIEIILWEALDSFMSLSPIHISSKETIHCGGGLQWIEP